MQTLGKRLFKNTLIFFVFIYLIELVIMFNLGNKFFTWASLRIALSSLIFSIIISLLVSFKKVLWRNMTATIIGFALMIYSWIEVNLYFYMGFFMGIGNTEQGTKVLDYIREYLSASKPATYLIFLLYILLCLYYWLIDRKLLRRKINKTCLFKFVPETKISRVYKYIGALLIITLLSPVYYSTLKLDFMQNKLQSISNEKLFINPENSNLSVSQFGVLTFGLTDSVNVIFNIDSSEEYEYEFTYNNHEKQVTDFSRYINDDAWSSLIEKETNTTYNKLNNYFINRKITPKNEYTGIFEGKNLIVILMESIGELAINPDLYPNIYKLYTEGMSFRNNYSPRNNCATGNNEMASMTSLYTINNTCTASTYKKNTYFESIFNLFNNIGYTTSSYHNYMDFYYSRPIIHKNMGSMIYRNASNLGIKWSALYQEWPSDVDLIEKAIPYFINEDRFMAYLTTVTTHQPYRVSSTYGDMHLDKLTEYNYSKDIKRYLSKLFELDAALGLLIDKLTEAGKLDDTVIVLFGDHYPYGLSSYTDEMSEYLGYNVELNNDVDRTPLIIYNSAQEPKVIEKYTSVIDVLPTIFNLFNMNYDPRLYLGNDIFSNYEDRVVFADGSWQDKLGFYQSTKSKFIPKDENISYSNEDLIRINNEISLKQKMSALAIRNNYFAYLEKGLKQYNSNINNE